MLQYGAAVPDGTALTIIPGRVEMGRIAISRYINARVCGQFQDGCRI